MKTTTRTAYPKAMGGLLIAVLMLWALGCGADPKGGPGEVEHHNPGAPQNVVVQLTAQQEAAAGITLSEVGPGALSETLRLVARVESNADAEAHVNPRAGGIVRAIHKGLGDTVARGDLLAEIDSVELGNLVADFLKDREQVAAARETLTKESALFTRRIDTQTRVADGAIKIAQRIYDREKSLQEQAIATLRPFLEADKALQAARLTKERDLTRLRAERDARELQLQVALRKAQIDLQAARVRLGIMGLSAADIALASEPKNGNFGRYGRLLVNSPIEGVVVARDVTLNESVDSSTTLFQIEDLSTVWIVASVYEKDLARLSLGQKVRVRLNALPKAEIHGELSFIDFQIAAATRTAAVRIVVDNHRRKDWDVTWPMRPGMFGTADVIINSRRAAVVIPESAIVHDGKLDFVFVAVPDEEHSFELRPVRILDVAGDDIEVLAGLNPGEKIAVQGIFYLKSLSKQGEIGEGE